MYISSTKPPSFPGFKIHPFIRPTFWNWEVDFLLLCLCPCPVLVRNLNAETPYNAHTQRLKGKKKKTRPPKSEVMREGIFALILLLAMIL